MLSRFADNLYWLGRYIERAENTARLLDVNYYAIAENLLPGDWTQLLNMSGNPEEFAQFFPQVDEQSVTEWLAFTTLNPGSIRNSLGLARENARSVRYYLNLEMFEALNQAYNTLYFGTENVLMQEGLHDYCVKVREVSHQFLGIGEATLPRDEAHLFLRAGRYLERLDNVLRILQAYLREGDPQEPLSRAFLRSASALEAFRKTGKQFDPDHIVLFLLRESHFPRSALYCARLLHETLERLHELNQADATPTELAGWLWARLRYGPIDLDRFDAEAWLSEVTELSNTIHRIYFETRPLARFERQMNQQQQARLGLGL